MQEFPFSQRAHSRFVRITLVLAVLVGVALLLQLGSYRARESSLHDSAIAAGASRVDRIYAELEQVLQRVEERTRDFGKALEAGEITPETLLTQLEQESKSEPYLLGLTVAYAKNEYPGRSLYAPYFDVARGEMLFCEEFYDYTDPAKRADALWYQDALQASERGYWVAAYGPAAGTTYVGYSIPFRNVRGQTAGVVNASVSMAMLGELVNKRFVGRLGGGVMIDGKGMLIVHPVYEHVSAGRRADVVARESGDSLLAHLALRKVGDGPRRFDSVPSFGVDGGAWLYERPVSRTGWHLGIAVFENELPHESRELRRRRTAALLTGLVLLVLVLGVSLRVDKLRDLAMWLFVSVFTLACIACTVTIWTWTLAEARLTEPRGSATTAEEPRVVADAAGLATFIEDERARARDARRPVPSFIPTGLELQSLRFVDGETVQVGGVVWQTYGPEHEGLARAIRFANLAPDPEGASLEEVTRRTSGDRERIVWEFRCLLRVRFDFTLYPFDRQVVPIALGHPAIDRRVVLTPDLDRYAVLNSNAKPGVADLVLPGWTVLGSRFRYEVHDSSIGFDTAAGRSRVPELSFTVTAQRQVLSPFLSYLVPLLIVLVLLHGVLISSSFNSDKKNTTGFSTFGVLETSGAFFFAIVFLHIDLRSALSLDMITYLEALYIVAYSMLILVAVNSLVFTETDAIAVLEYRDNLIAKLCYWPVLSAFCLIVTVWIFF